MKKPPKRQRPASCKQDRRKPLPAKREFKVLESGKEAILEDLIRIKDMLRAIQLVGDRGFRRSVNGLIGKLEAVTCGDLSDVTLASKIVMRKIRKSWVRHVVKVFRACKGYPISFVTLLPRSLELPENGLEDFDPEAANNALRSYLNRRGINKCKGWVIGALHGEFDGIKKVWRIHWHLLVCGEMIPVFDGLRTEADFKSKKGEAPRVRMTRKPITDIRRLASYLLQSWWPDRPKGKFASHNRECRGSIRFRIKEPFQTRWLLWIDKLKLSDLTLLIGVRRTPSGFKITKL